MIALTSRGNIPFPTRTQRNGSVVQHKDVEFFAIAENLLMLGANPNAKNEQGFAPVHTVAKVIGSDKRHLKWMGAMNHEMAEKFDFQLRQTDTGVTPL
jgi:hypothetical protein